jgi:hypothetical protein
MGETLRQQACKQTLHVLSLYKQQQQAQDSVAALQWQQRTCSGTHIRHTAVATARSCLLLDMKWQQEQQQQRRHQDCCCPRVLVIIIKLPDQATRACITAATAPTASQQAGSRFCTFLTVQYLLQASVALSCPCCPPLCGAAAAAAAAGVRCLSALPARW